jgi:tyrosyl-tRNA synthetase
MTLSEELRWRGFLNQSTISDLSKLDSQKLTFYHGFDASADSQTIGNLAGMMLDRLFMRHGHKAVILAGGATSLIGDPGGKDEERPLQSAETVAHNIEQAKEQLTRVYSGYEFELVNNLDWTKDLTVIAYLRDIGKHFSMTPLIQRDYISKRLGENSVGISYAEFSYTILQGMDYLHLFDNYGVTLQLGGSDQWGNILSGVELIRRARAKEAHGLTLPLIINQATGKKFGKTEEGAVWLDPKKTSPFQFYQFWINIDDAWVEDYLKIYTELSKDDIDHIMTEFMSNAHERHAQKRLADEVTLIVHGAEAAKRATVATNVVVGQMGVGNVSDSVIDTIREEFPNLTVSLESSVISALVSTELVQSNSEARRLLESGAIYINGQKAERENFEPSDFQNGRLLLRRGKAFKDTAIIELS